MSFYDRYFGLDLRNQSCPPLALVCECLLEDFGEGTDLNCEDSLAGLPKGWWNSPGKSADKFTVDFS